MNRELKRKIEHFVETRIVSFHNARAANINELKLAKLLKAKNPYLFRAKHLEIAADFVKALLDARLSSSEEGSFGGFMEELAIFVASETGNGQKSSTTGLDIELERDKVRYLIAVKSGNNWGNSSQHTALKANFASAVRVLRQSKQTGQVQPTLGICYGSFKTNYKPQYLHIGGQDFWRLLSGDSELYTALIEPLGHQAEQLNQAFETEKANAYNRMTREFLSKYCLNDGAIDWVKLVRFVSKNVPDHE